MQRLSTTQQQYPFDLNGAHKVGFGAQNSNKTKVLNKCMYIVQSRVHSKGVAVALLLECWSVLRWCQIKSLINSKLQNMAKGHPYNVFFFSVDNILCLLAAVFFPPARQAGAHRFLH